MRHLVPLVVLTASVSAADPPAVKKDPSRTYIESLAATAELLAKVKDE